MKHILRWICPVLFLSACIIVIWFLHLFTVESDSMQEIQWQTAVKMERDGTQTPISTDELTQSTNYSGTYHFTGILPEGLSSGYLLFEISGANLSLFLNGYKFLNQCRKKKRLLLQTFEFCFLQSDRLLMYHLCYMD